MYVCMDVCMDVCMYVCMYVCMNDDALPVQCQSTQPRMWARFSASISASKSRALHCTAYAYVHVFVSRRVHM